MSDKKGYYDLTFGEIDMMQAELGEIISKHVKAYLDSHNIAYNGCISMWDSNRTAELNGKTSIYGKPSIRIYFKTILEIPK